MDLEDIFSGTGDSPKKGKAEKITAKDGHTYHKSSSANATEAPTNKGTLTALDEKIAAVGAGLTSFELDFLMMCQMYYDIYHVLIPEEVAVKRYGITAEIYQNTLALPQIQTALVANKIIKDPEDKAEVLLPREDVLTPMELVVANTMLDLLDTRSDKKKLQDLGMSTQDYQRLLRKPAFYKYCQEKADTLLQVGQHEASLALMDRVRQGDLKSIQYLHEYTGKFTPASKQSSTTVNVNQSSSDLQWIVTHLIEIIVEEVEDAPTAARIGDRIKTLIGASRMAAELAESQRSEVIVEPAVAPMRKDSDVIKAIEQRAGVNKDK